MLGRFSRLSALIVAAAVAACSISGYYVVRYSLEQQIDSELVQVASQTSEPLINDWVSMGGLNETALSAANVLLILLSSDGVVNRVKDGRPWVTPGDPEQAVALTQFGHSTRTIMGSDGQPYRVVAVPLQIDMSRYALVLARPFTPTLDTLSTIRWLLWTVGSAFVVLALVAGISSGTKVVAPLHDLADAVAHIAQTDELIPIGNQSSSEVGDLSRAFDSMVGSLAQSRERQTRLIADAGHELRTPLTSMRTNVELLVADAQSEMLPKDTRIEILGDVASQLGEFSSLVADLMQLSRETRMEPGHSEPVDLAEVVTHAVQRVKRRGPGLNFDVQLEPYLVSGESDTLERAVINLLDNAVKWSPKGGTVSVSLSHGVLSVADDGPGIAPEDLPHIFERFYRSDKTRNTPGTGLGLSIVAHTIDAHGGTVAAGSSPSGGALFTVALPPATVDVVE
ncbi:MAG: HAMP domain-containing histidine kinase [Propionibacteriaceae bacterium]|nr:HAMP domain-containing histidine kinase [Propionibacteriaceae bacterium]